MEDIHRQFMSSTFPSIIQLGQHGTALLYNKIHVLSNNFPYSSSINVQ